MSPLRAKSFILQLVTEEETLALWLIWKKANIQVVNCLWDHMEKTCGQPLGAKSGSWLTTSKKAGTSALQSQQLNSANNLSELERKAYAPDENSSHLTARPFQPCVLEQRIQLN